MNIWDILLLAALAAAAGLAVGKIAADRKKGRSGCGCDCAHCAQNCGRREK